MGRGESSVYEAGRNKVPAERRPECGGPLPMLQELWAQGSRGLVALATLAVTWREAPDAFILNCLNYPITLV